MRVIIILIFLTSNISAQDKRGNVWVLGLARTDTSQLVTLDFNADSLQLNTFRSDHSMADPSITTYCDKNGELVLYSNGCEIFNKHHQVIQNGHDLISEFDLFGSCETRGYSGNTLGVLFAANPCDSTKVHLVYLDLHNESFELLSKNLLRTTVDISNPDDPVVIEKNVVISETIYEKGALFITRHKNGIDWWISLLELKSNCYNSFLLSQDGFSEPVRSCTGPIWVHPSQQSLGGGVGAGGFSPDGSTYVRFNFTFGLNVYDFDNTTGVLTHREQIFLEEDDFLGYVGAAISSNSRFLYASAKYRLYQFDLHADTIANSGVIVDTLDFSLANSQLFFLSNLAPDGKIYIVGFNSLTGLHVVHHPNKKGLACDVEQLGLRFPDGIVHLAGLPNNPWYGELPNTTLCDSMVSVTDVILEENDIKIYPNPTTDKLTIELEQTTLIDEISVTDLTGRKVFTTQPVIYSKLYDLELSAIQPGIHFIEVITKIGKYQRKFIKL